MLRRRFLQESVPFDMSNYMTMEALVDDFQFKCGTTEVEYTVDGKKWTKLAANTLSETFSSGQFISVRSKLQPGETFGRFMTRQCNLHGNCLSLIFGDSAKDNIDISEYPYVFDQTFYQQTAILNVDKNFLPALKIGDYSYYHMFESCTNLISAPDLPATILGNYCYATMFGGCSKLTRIPSILPTSVFGNLQNCYNSMFASCPYITKAPILPALGLNYPTNYASMFQGCTRLSRLEIHLRQFPNSLFTLKTMIGNNAGSLASTREIYYNIEGGSTAVNALSQLNTSWILNTDNPIVPYRFVIVPIKLGSVDLSTQTYIYDMGKYANENGDTWESWINSPYNPGHFYIDDEGYVKSYILGDLIIDSTTRVYKSDNITIKQTYACR
jgi:hypothetical protein